MRSARQALTELLFDGDLKSGKSAGKTSHSAINLFQTLEIYPGSKLSHFREIHVRTFCWR